MKTKILTDFQICINVPLSFSSTLELIYGIPNDRQKLLRYFNRIEIVLFLKTQLLPLDSVFHNNLTIHMKDLNCYFSQHYY